MRADASDKSLNSLGWVSDLILQKGRPFGHVTFWLGVLFFYTLYFGSRADGYGQSLGFVALLLPITIATTYFLLYWLIPRYLLQQRYFPFCVYFLYTLISTLYLELMLVLLLYINVSGYQALFVRPGLVDLMDVIVGMYLVIFLAVAINLLKRWFVAQSEKVMLESAQMESNLKLKDAELQMLKSQLQPHFLFNTLNNLYALALEHSERVPDVVLKISQQLDYMLYRGNQEMVPVEEEWNHIQNYLELESLRYDDKNFAVNIEVEGDLKRHYIAPLLLIPFIENSFKHGVSRVHAAKQIQIRLALKEGELTFDVSNDKKTDPSKEPDNKDQGIGLANVRRRLTLLYPNRHTLDIQESATQFKVHLYLKLNGSA